MLPRFGTLTLAVIPVAIVIDVVAGQLTAILRLPLYLDSLGTVFVGVVAGPLAGALTGFMSNVVWGLVIAPTALPFAITGAVIGLLAGVLGRRGAFKKLVTVVIGGLLTGVIAAIVSAPIATFVFGGVTGAGTDALVAFFQSMGASILQATLGQGLVSDPLDKAITFVLVFVVLRSLPSRLLMRFPQGDAA